MKAKVIMLPNPLSQDTPSGIFLSDEYLDATVDMYNEGISLKLNPQGEVDITIPEEKTYSKEEVKELCNRAMYILWSPKFSKELVEECFEAWSNKNIK